MRAPLTSEAAFSRQLALVVLAAALSGGCCEVMHLGWARSYGPRDYRELRSVDARSLAKARVLENGRLDASSCNALCGATDDLEVVACRPVTVAFPPSATRVLVCDFGSGVEPQVKVTLSRAEAASWTSSGTGGLPVEVCRSRCTRGEGEVRGCSLEPEPRVAMQPTSATVPLLACAYHKPGGCGSPVLSRHEGEAPARGAARANAPTGTCTGVSDPLGDEKTVD